MPTNILIAIILFGITITAYLFLLPIRSLGGKLGPIPVRALVITMLLNCVSQVYLLLHGHVTCSIIFVMVNALEALAIGLISESALSAAMRLKENKPQRWMKEYWKDKPDTILPEGTIFHSNIDLTRIANSMQLDSGQIAAKMENDVFSAVLAVCGKVRVIWNPDPAGSYVDGTVYKAASQFPEELMKVFAQNKNIVDMPNIYVDDWNWFEIRIEDKKTGGLIYSDYVNAEGLSEEDVKTMLFEELKAQED